MDDGRLFNRNQDSCIVYNSLYDQAMDYYDDGDYKEGMELLLSYIEIGLTGEAIHDNERAARTILRSYYPILQKNTERYNVAIQSKRDSRRDSQKLDDIARMIKEGVSQSEMAEKLNVTQGTISNRIKLIKKEYNFLLLDTENPHY